MKRKVLFTVLGVTLGAGLGWLYWNYFGCTNGCAITSSPVNSSLYGALMGGLMVNTFKRDGSRPTDGPDRHTNG